MFFSFFYSLFCPSINKTILWKVSLFWCKNLVHELTQLLVPKWTSPLLPFSFKHFFNYSQICVFLIEKEIKCSQLFTNIVLLNFFSDGFLSLLLLPLTISHIIYQKVMFFVKNYDHIFMCTNIFILSSWLNLNYRNRNGYLEAG